jgi:hypothetical protein
MGKNQAYTGRTHSWRLTNKTRYTRRGDEAAVGADSSRPSPQRSPFQFPRPRSQSILSKLTVAPRLAWQIEAGRRKCRHQNLPNILASVQ